jgi:tripartite ATP-independent transporter DctP family solute receptor
MRKGVSLLIACAAIIVARVVAEPGTITLRYAHMNSQDSIAAKQSVFFAERVERYSGGSLTVEIYPDSQLGSLKDQLEEVSSGVIAFHHNTAGAIGSLFEDYAVLDTPYIYRSVQHLLKVVDPASPVMEKLKEGLLKKTGLRVLYSFYFGSRELSCDRLIRTPADLKGLKIRSIPFPIYETAIEGLGAIATPIDWSLTPTALDAKVVDGQDNPVDIVLSSKLYESQPYLMLTDHIMAAESVLVNDSIWRGLSSRQRDAITRAASEASAYATSLMLAQEADEIAALKAKGMKIIGPKEGLEREAFRASTRKLVDERFGPKWKEYYRLIDDIK